MNEAQRRAWHALGIGPAWIARGPPGLARPASAAEDFGHPAPDAGRLDHPAPETEPLDLSQPDAGPLGLPQSDAGRLERVAPPAVQGQTPALLDWPALREAVAGCRACRLCETRTNTVFGIGDEQANWMVIGEAPGADEDRRGEPFVGKAGQLLDAMLAAVGKSRRSGVFIANVLKCRPPGNRDPQADEAARCQPFLQRQIELVSPRVIVALGRTAAQSLLGTDGSLASLRGTVHEYAVGSRTIPLVVTYHPAYLLRTPQDKAKAWVDLQLARRLTQP
jgi:DNA polymerase